MSRRILMLMWSFVPHIVGMTRFGIPEVANVGPDECFHTLGGPFFGCPSYENLTWILH